MKITVKKMTKRVSALVTGLIGAAATIAVVITTFIDPNGAELINTAIGIGTTAAVEISNLFTE